MPTQMEQTTEVPVITTTEEPTTTTTTTSTSTTTTTTTAEPCTGGCTWRWSAAGQTWLRYGTGNCSTGCSCQAPTSPGTTDGEYQTVSCGRLTCQACCNVTDCCPATPIETNCCDLAVPSILNVTIDTGADCPCGLTSFQLAYDGSGTYGPPGWYVRNPTVDWAYPGPALPSMWNGTCVIAADLCTYGVNTGDLNPEKTFVNAHVRCEYYAGSYRWYFSFGYGRIRYNGSICSGVSIAQAFQGVTLSCDPFYYEILRFSLADPNNYNPSGCDDPAGTVDVYFTT